MTISVAVNDANRLKAEDRPQRRLRHDPDLIRLPQEASTGRRRTPPRPMPTSRQSTKLD